MTDSNPGSLVSGGTALPTVPQPQLSNNVWLGLSQLNAEIIHLEESFKYVLLIFELMFGWVEK